MAIITEPWIPESYLKAKALYPARSKYYGIHEYCAPQRWGKNTLLQIDLMDKLLTDGGFEPDDVHCNFMMFIKGVHCYDTKGLIAAVNDMWARNVRHIVIVFDETGQFLIARQSMNKDQTSFVLKAWQMPKRDWVCLYADNPGNSADCILRLATQVTLLPRYFHGLTRDEDFILYDVIWNHDCMFECANRVDGLAWYQQFYDTEAAVE